MAGGIIENTGEDLLVQTLQTSTPKRVGVPLGAVRQDRYDPYASPEGRLEREYNRLLIERGFGEKRSSLKKLDRIDVRGICRMPQNKFDFPLEIDGLSAELEADYALTEGETESLLHCILPCFTDGVMQLNANLELHWKVLDADMEAQMEDVEFKLYHDEGCGWAPLNIVRVRIKAPAQAEELPYILHAFGADAVRIPWDNELPDWYAVHNAIPSTELPWTDKDKLLWQTYMQTINMLQPDREVSFIRVGKDGDREETKISNAVRLAKIWASAVLAVNILLWARTQAMKPVESSGWEKVEASSDGKEKTEAEVGADTGQPEVNKRTVRTVGGVTLVSEKPPKCVTAAGARNYKVAEWKRRGHPRHYKSGKVVWIDETTVHRKAVDVPGADALPVTIKVKGPRR